MDQYKRGMSFTTGGDPRSAAPAVILSDVHKKYGSVRALDGMSLTIQHGDVTALLGPNGAGKTTLMEIITGIRLPDSGSVDVLGADPGRDRIGLAARIGVQVQEFNLQSTVRVREALAFFATLHAEPEDVDELLERFGLVEKATARFPTLSGGQKRRLAIAKALVGRPELVVLDEPTSGLDPQGQEFLRRETRRLRQEGRTVLLSTHDVDDAARLAEAVIVVDRGRVVAAGAPRDIVQAHCRSVRVVVDAAPEPHWTGPDITVSDDIGRTIIYANSVQQVQELVGDATILEHREPTLHDAYFHLTGTGLRS